MPNKWGKLDARFSYKELKKSKKRKHFFCKKVIMVEVFHLRALLKKNQNSTVIYGRFKTVDRLYNYQASGIVLILKLKYVIEDEYTSFSGIRTSIIVAWCFFSSHSIAVSKKQQVGSLYFSWKILPKN